MRLIRFGFTAWMLLLLSALPAQATDNFNSLVAQIRAANSSGSGAITLRGDITLASALPAITGELTIDGAGHTISGGGEYRIFQVYGGKLVMRNLTLTKGGGEDGGALRIRGAANVEITGSAFNENRASTGGAISIHGAGSRLSIENSSFDSNSAVRWAGAIDVVGASVTIQRSSFTNNSSQDYGGVLVTASGSIQISNSTFHSNHALFGATIHVYGDEATLTHVTMTSNIASLGIGNAINRQGGIVRLRNSIVAGGGSGDDCANGLDEAIGNLSVDGSCSMLPTNFARLGQLTGSPAWRPLLNGSPAIDAAEPALCLETDQRGISRPYGDACDIGAIETTSAQPAPRPIVPPPPCPLELRIVAANTDAPAGGCPAGNGHDIITLERDIELYAALPIITSDITIQGNGHTISGRGFYRIFRVQRGKLTLNDMTLTRGNGYGDNSGGGAVWLEAVGQLEANRVTFSDNSGSTGGAIGSMFWGISFTVNDSHFVNNTASDSGGAIGMNGGGYARINNSSFVDNRSRWLGGAISSMSGRITASNSTFIGNQARRGGAIAVEAYRPDRPIPLTLTHLTMLDNAAALGESIFAGDDYDDVAVRLRNSIIAGSDAEVDDCDVQLAQNASNFIADGSCAPKLSGDPLLGEATGSPVHLPLLPGSRAIDAANATFCAERDQPGSQRPLGYGCDMGAVEMMPPKEQLSGCEVRTTHGLNFRETPGGERIGSVPQGATLPARARTPGWFRVEYNGATGWISADYVTTEGDCD